MTDILRHLQSYVPCRPIKKVLNMEPFEQIDYQLFPTRDQLVLQIWLRNGVLRNQSFEVVIKEGNVITGNQYGSLELDNLWNIE